MQICSDDDVRADGFIADQNFHIGVEASPMPVPGWKSHPELREAEAAEISEQENPRVFPEASSLRDSRAVEMLSVTGEPVQICETRISISISSSFHRAETVWNIPLRLLRMAARYPVRGQNNQRTCSATHCFQSVLPPDVENSAVVRN